MPLLEAMHHHVPIVAYGVAAIPETLGGAGLVLRSKDPATLADVSSGLGPAMRSVAVSALREDERFSGRGA